MKRKLPIILVLCLILSFVPSNALSASAAASTASGTCGDDLTWTLDSSGTLTISGSGDMDDYKSAGKTEWYDYHTSIRKIVISSGVTSIGDYAFASCLYVTDVSIADSVTSIGDYAFQSNFSLTSISLPDSLTSIGDDAFCLCTNLSQITIPDSVTQLGSSAFYGCTGLTTATLSDSLTGIADYLFWCCECLESITIPDGVISIGNWAFRNCYELNSVTLSNSVSSIGSSAFYDCDDLSDVYFYGTQSDWDAISISSGNDCLTDANLNYCTWPISSASITLSQSSYTYTGTAFEPGVTVTYGSKTLVENTDYTVAYSNNTSAGTAEVTVTGMGLYSGTAAASFTIEGVSISSADLSLSETGFVYSGTAYTPEVTVTLDGSVLTKDTDYTVAYSDNLNAGTATVTVTGIGNYKDATTASFEITRVSISEAEADVAESYTYTGTGITALPVIVWNGTTLTIGTDYTLSYSDNTNVGTATVTAAGTGNYTGSVSATFDILQADINSAIITLAYSSCTYSGSALEPAVYVALGDVILEENADYTVSYENNIEPGTASVIVTGIGNCTGSASETFEIVAASLQDAEISLSESEYEYDGEAKTPDVTVTIGETVLIAGTDYTFTYADNVNPGTARIVITGCGNYTDTVTVSFIIECTHAYDSIVTDPTCTQSGYTTYTCAKCGDTYVDDETAATGHSYTSVVTKEASCTEEGVLTCTCSVCGDSYTETIARISHSYEAVVTDPNCTEGGYTTYTCRVCGESYTDDETAATGHSYSGNVCTVCGTLKTASVSSASVKLSTTSYTYDGSAKKPTAAVKVNGTTLEKGTDYTISYKNNINAGTATVTVTGKGSYSGSISKTFTIKKASQKLTVKKSTKTVRYSNIRKKKLTVKAITKVSGAKGKVTYKKTSGKSYFTVNSKTGKITVKKGTKKGTYKIKIRITSAATSNYSKATKTVTVTIKVK